MNVPGFTITADAVTARFGRQTLFDRLGFAVTGGQSLAITGANGSGKSTLLEIIAGLQRPASGSVTIRVDGSPSTGAARDLIGFMSPRVNPYPDLTGIENARFAARTDDALSRADVLLERFALSPHRDKPVRLYSSGMRQRLKIVIALVNDAPALILDEPGANLDDAGTRILREHIAAARAGRVIIIATNDESEAALCERRIGLG